MNNRSILIGICAALLVAGGVVGFLMMRQEAQPSNEIPANVSPTPTEALQEAPETIEVSMAVNKARTAVTIDLSGLDNKYESLEYELQYMTGKGPKGSLSGTKPISLKDSEDSFTREIELGTCSTGGTCTYYKDVRDFKLTLKLHTKEGDVQILQKTYDEL